MSDRFEDRREDERRRQRKKIEDKMSFFTHLIVYLFVNGFIFYPNDSYPGIGNISLPTIAWGAALVAHFIKTFVYNSDYIDRKVDQIMDKEK